MPADTPMVLVPGKWTRSVEEYLAHYGSGCRDCADEAGACPASGMTCDFDQRMAAFRHALKAINYGVKQGYLAISAPAEPVERLCPCGKPALPTASICSDCADACLASGEGEAPVAWHRAESVSQTLLYTLVQQGWRRGEPVMVNEDEVRVSGPNREAVAARILEALSRPTPATPEGLREAPSVPTGWIMVPEHPTSAMKRAGARVNGMGWDFAHECWAQMVRAVRS